MLAPFRRHRTNQIPALEVVERSGVSAAQISTLALPALATLRTKPPTRLGRPWN